MVDSAEKNAATQTRSAMTLVKTGFVRLGVLPFLLVISVIVFSFMSDRYLTTNNLMNVARQSTYLTLVAMGQMLALLTGGFDLSVGTMLAVTSVVGALAMSGLYAAFPDLAWLAITGGMLVGFGAGFYRLHQ